MLFKYQHLNKGGHSVLVLKLLFLKALQQNSLAMDVNYFVRCNCFVPANNTDSVYLYLLNVKYSLISSLISKFSLDKEGLASV